MRYRWLLLSSLLLTSCANTEPAALCLSLNRLELSVGESKVISVFEGKGPFTFVSSAPDIVSVDENGLATALQEGEARISVSNEKETVYCYVTVKKQQEAMLPRRRCGMLSLTASCPSFGFNDAKYHSPAYLVYQGDDADSSCVDLSLPITDGRNENGEHSADWSLNNLKALHNFSTMPNRFKDHSWSNSYITLGKKTEEILSNFEDGVGGYVSGQELENRLQDFGNENLSLTYSSYFLEGAVYLEKDASLTPHYYENRDVPLKEYANQVENILAIADYFFSHDASMDDYRSLLIPFLSGLPISSLMELEIDEELLRCFDLDIIQGENNTSYSFFLKEENTAVDEKISEQLITPIDMKTLQIDINFENDVFVGLSVQSEFDQESQANRFEAELSVDASEETIEADYFDKIEERNSGFRN